MRGSTLPFAPMKTYGPVFVNLKEKRNPLIFFVPLSHTCSLLFFSLFFPLFFLLYLLTRTLFFLFALSHFFLVFIFCFLYSFFSFLSFFLFYFFSSFSLFYFSFRFATPEWSKSGRNFPPLSSIATCHHRHFSLNFLDFSFPFISLF